MTERQLPSEEVQKVLDALVESKYEEIITDREEFGRFRRFLLTRAIPNKAYVIAYPTSAGGYAWFRYTIDKLKKAGRKKLAVATKLQRVYLNEDFTAKSIPEPCQNLPVWYLDGGGNV